MGRRLKRIIYGAKNDINLKTIGRIFRNKVEYII